MWNNELVRLNLTRVELATFIIVFSHRPMSRLIQGPIKMACIKLYEGVRTVPRPFDWCHWLLLSLDLNMAASNSLVSISVSVKAPLDWWTEWVCHKYGLKRSTFLFKIIFYSLVDSRDRLWHHVTQFYCHPLITSLSHPKLAENCSIPASTVTLSK